MKEDDLRTGYDAIAGEYAVRLSGELDGKPLDRALLARFVGETAGTVCDLGCGPGHVARYLRFLGAEEVIGVDISSGMVEQARRDNPEMEFRQGDMLALDFGEGSLGGIVAFYSLIHIPHEDLPRALGEMRRVLKPGGVLLLSFHVGDEIRHLDEMWGRKVSLDFHFFRPDDIENILTDAGFTVEETIERPPYGEDVEVQTDRAYIFARKPGVR